MINEDVKAAIDSSVKEIIKAKIEEFAEAPPEIAELNFPIFFTKDQRNEVHKYSAENNIKSHTLIRNGTKKSAVVYKKNFTKFVSSPATIQLTPSSRQVILRHVKDNMTNSNDKNKKCKGEVKSIESKITPYAFCVGTFTNFMLTVPPPPTRTDFDSQKLPIFPYKLEINNCINSSQVSLIMGHSAIGKSTQIPQFILEDATAEGRNCRIISATNTRLAALAYSYKVASQRGEKLGQSVGYQIRLESMSCTSTNLLFTTSSFFLRCLISSPTKQIFKGVTHIIVDDVDQRSCHTDVLLYQLKEAITEYPHLKVILIGNPISEAIIRGYFLNVQVLHVNIKLGPRNLYFLEDVLRLTQYVDESEGGLADLQCTAGCFQGVFDNVLSEYMLKRTHESFNYILQVFDWEGVTVDAQHSSSGLTTLMVSAFINNLEHVKILTSLGVNFLAVDVYNRSALNWAENGNSLECFEFINSEIMNKSSENKSGLTQDDKLLLAYEKTCAHDQVDYQLVKATINYIYCHTKFGTILVFLPSFNDLKHMQFIINESGMENIDVYLLHEKIFSAEYKGILEMPDNSNRRIILATSIAESILSIPNTVFVIDTARYYEYVPNEDGISLSELEWISKSCLNTRSCLAGRSQEGYSFHLLPKSKYETLRDCKQAELSMMPLHNICLYVKLLSPDLSIRSHFSRLIVNPPDKNINDSIEYHLKIGTIDEYERVTPLGVCLIDIPIDVQLGKIIVFAIMLQCLDPVVTIVSSLNNQYTWTSTRDRGGQQMINLNWKSLAEDTLSDHLVLLRIYQNWQDEIATGGRNTFTDRESFVLNGTLENICSVRSQIIGALRAVGLIQVSSVMTMHSANLNASSWPMVKACFVGGLYPNLCRIDPISMQIKANQRKSLMFHPTSVLNDANLITLSPHCKSTEHHSDKASATGSTRKRTKQNHSHDKTSINWIMYQEKTIAENYNHIKFNTVVSPISVALFARDAQMTEMDLLKSRYLLDSDSDDDEGGCKSNRENLLHIDEWIIFQLSPEDMHLVLNLRQMFSDFMHEVLVASSDTQQLRKLRYVLTEKFKITKVFRHLLELEEDSLGLKQPERIGERPKAVSLKFASGNSFLIEKNNPTNTKSVSLSSFAAASSLPIKMNINLDSASFFILIGLNRSEISNCFDIRSYSSLSPGLRRIIEIYCQNRNSDSYIFLLVEGIKQFVGVAKLSTHELNFYLKPVLEKNIDFQNLKIVYATAGKEYHECYDGEELEADIGKLFFNMFA